MQRVRGVGGVSSGSNTSQSPIVIVGAGASGLICAQILHRNGIPVVVVEAQDYVGGRVKQLKGFVEWKVLDLGAEFVHGEKSILKTIIDKNGWPCRLLFTWAQGDGETPDYPVGGGISLYYLGKENKLLRYDTEDADINKVNSLMWNLWEVKPAPGDNRTLKQYLLDNGVSERALQLADAGYANTLCSTLDKIALSNVAELEATWDKYGGGDYRLDGSLGQVIEYLQTDLEIRLNWPVKQINYEKENIILTGPNGETMEASKVVVTVPLPILKDGDIDFVPPLPDPKLNAIKFIGIDGAMKVVMKFSQRFWPPEVHGVICADSFLPELWFEDPNRVGVLTPQSRPPKQNPVNVVIPSKNNLTIITTTTTINNSTGEIKSNAVVTTQPASTYLVSGFATSKNAERLGKMSKEQIIEAMLQQLDTMFRTNSADKLLTTQGSEIFKYDEAIDWRSPASSVFLDCLVYDWSKQPYVRGGYSSSTVGATRQVREDLARPIDDRIYFAGEATNPQSYMTLHGAMETGEIAANNILESINSDKKRKKKSSRRSKL